MAFLAALPELAEIAGGAGEAAGAAGEAGGGAGMGAKHMLSLAQFAGQHAQGGGQQQQQGGGGLAGKIGNAAVGAAKMLLF